VAPFIFKKVIPAIEEKTSFGIFVLGQANGEPIIGAPSPKPRFKKMTPGLPFGMLAAFIRGEKRADWLYTGVNK
ncbi:hypothetical protein, partial [Dryocola clanedunensis]|uniref:hypothetical protein n=1 Tax=Dryocola clanedunensis TaxID=2925396 RepID=UPI0038CC0ADF